MKGWDRQAGGGSGGGRMTGRRTTNSFLGGDDGGRIQGEDMRSRTDQMEGGAREKTGGAGQIRWREEPGRRQEGLGAGGVRWTQVAAMVDSTEGSAMVEPGLMTPGDRPTAVEQVEM